MPTEAPPVKRIADYLETDLTTARVGEVTPLLSENADPSQYQFSAFAAMAGASMGALFRRVAPRASILAQNLTTNTIASTDRLIAKWHGAGSAERQLESEERQDDRIEHDRSAYRALP